MKASALVICGIKEASTSALIVTDMVQYLSLAKISIFTFVDCFREKFHDLLFFLILFFNAISAIFVISAILNLRVNCLNNFGVQLEEVLTRLHDSGHKGGVVDTGVLFFEVA